MAEKSDSASFSFGKPTEKTFKKSTGDSTSPETTPTPNPTTSKGDKGSKQAENASEDTGFITTLFKEFQKSLDIITLPQPFLHEGKLVSRVTIQEITGAVEEEYNTPQNRENFGLFITACLSACVTHIGDDFSKSDYKAKEWKGIIRNMPMSDRDYLMFCIYRLCKQNDIIEMKDAECPACKRKGYEISIGELEVKHYSDPVPEFSFVLPRGYVVGAITYKQITAKLPDGYAQERTSPLYSTAGSKADTAMISMCADKISNVEANRVLRFDMDIARALSKIDRDAMAEAIGKKSPGITTVAGMECDCGEKFFVYTHVVDFFLRR